MYALSSSQNDVPSVNLVKPLKTHTIRELSWWIKCCRHHPHPMSASKAVYCLEVCKTMAANLSVIDIDGRAKKKGIAEPMYVSSHSLRHQAHLSLLWDGSLTREKWHAKFRSFQGTPSNEYDYLSGISVQPSAETLRALKKGYTLWMSGRVQSIHINDRHPRLHLLKESIYAVHWMKKRDTYISHAMCQCPAGWGNTGVHSVTMRL